MPDGSYPNEFLREPHIPMSIEDIYSRIDEFSGEFFEKDINCHNSIDFIIPFPPVFYEGVFVKGLFLSQGVDYLIKRFPALQSLFFSMSYSMWASYPWSEKCDALLTCYENEHREKWFKKNNPERADKIIVPLQDGDFLHEYFMAPTFNTPKDIDVLCISRPHELKNLYMLAETLKEYHQKYNDYITLTLVIGREFNALADFEKKELELMRQAYPEGEKYIKIISHVSYENLARYYSRAKVYFLASIFEGKNRTLGEAMSCNTPIMVFNDFNKYIRAWSPVFYDNAGEYIPEFTAQSAADTLRKMLTNLDSYEPRRSYIKYFGRLNFLNTCINKFDYYKNTLPEYTPKMQDNLWVDLAIQSNYQLGFHDFLYGKNIAIQHAQGIDNIEKMLNFFFSRFRYFI